MNRKIAVLLANGFEEGEALFVIDILRRAGFQCDGIALETKEVQGSHGIRVFADRMLEEVNCMEYDMVVLPGGLPGANTLRDCKTVIDWIKAFADDSKKFIGAICAAPQVLAKADVVRGKKLTSYPGEKYKALFTDSDYIDDNERMEECVVVDGNLITSRGPGTTLPFSYKLVEVLGGNACQLKEAMQYNALKSSLTKNAEGVKDKNR